MPKLLEGSATGLTQERRDRSRWLGAVAVLAATACAPQAVPSSSGAAGEAGTSDVRAEDGVEAVDVAPADAATPTDDVEAADAAHDADPWADSASDRAAGDGGMMGNGPCPVYPMRPACGVTSCGNGVLDRCLGPPYGTSPPPEYAEECDGVNLADVTCQSLGFASGTLACAANCTFDVESCSECSALDASLIRCGRPRTPGIAFNSFGLAATDMEVGLAWVGHDTPSEGASIRFARLDSNFDQISSAKLEDDCGAYGVSAAALASGWLVGVYAHHYVFDEDRGTQYWGDEVYVHALDTQGRPTARTTVAKLPASQPGHVIGPVVAERPGGGPLIAWAGDGKVIGKGLHVAVVSDDGRSVTEPIEVPFVTTDTMSAAFVQDSFYVVAGEPDAAPDGSRSYGFQLVRVAPDGSSASVVHALPGEPITNPALVQGADDLRITYSGMPPDLSAWFTMWRRISPVGEGVSRPMIISNRPSPSLGLAFGPETFAILGRGLAGWSKPAGEKGSGLVVIRVMADGGLVSPADEFAKAALIRQFRTVRRGPDAIVGWIGGGHIGIARLTP
jgi:hypothetical protein